MPDIEDQFVDVYGPQGLVVIALDPDADDQANIDAVREFVDTQGVTFQVATENSTETPTYRTLEEVYDGANPYPLQVLIDKQGVMRYIAREYQPQSLHQIIPDLLAE